MACVTVAYATPSAAREPSRLTPRDLEFIEHLGRWETADGQWVDPLELLEQPAGEAAGDLPAAPRNGDGDARPRPAAGDGAGRGAARGYRGNTP